MTIHLEVGAPGIAEGGSIFVLPDPFWFWSGAQGSDPDAPGYTTMRILASPAALPVRLVPTELPGAFRVEGRPLAEGEQVEIVYGAGPAGTVVDRYAERGSELRIGLDANGDGQRAWLADRLLVDVLPNAASELVAFGPAELAPGEPFEIQLALVDAAGNRADWPDAPNAAGERRARFTLRSLPIATIEPASGLGERESVSAEDAPHRLRLVAPGAEGTLRLAVRGTGALAQLHADLPPIVVRRSATRLYWADLHGHTRFSDGTGTPEDYFRYARDVARLDAIALTDHDHWGLDPLDENPERQAAILALVRAYHAPGRFVTLPGYEWTSWLHGHRHVLSFDDTLEIASSLDPATDRPDELWAFLRGKPVLTFAHHSAGEPVATNWHFAPDPELEPVTEIASVHGMSEAGDAPSPVAGAFEGNFVRDVLRHGARLGFIGSGDSHDGHPGLAQIAAGQGGLAGLFAEGLDRASLHAALKARRTFATNGIRAWLEVSIDGIPMGGLLAPGSADHLLRIRFEATSPIERIDLVRTGHVAALDPPQPGARSLDLERRIPRLGPGEFHYVRIVQADGGVAWSSPIFVEGRIASASPEAPSESSPDPERKSE
ncbi:MAG: CehA/McbA family metallohydrolase [Myxococcota bacterium]